MNSNFLLQNFIQNGNTTQQRPKKPTKSSHELQLLITTTFNEVCQMLEDHNSRIQVPEEGVKINERVLLFKDIISQLLQGGGEAQNENSTDGITCKNCQVYESNLQKLEGEVRQHIRLEQQLKIFEDNLEEQLKDSKKEKKELQRKSQNLKKQVEELKALNSGINQKLSKYEGQIQHIRKQNRQLKRSSSTNNEGLTTKRDSSKNYAYQAKQNKIDWVHRNISVKKQDKEKNQRKSVQKRNDSAEKGWRPSNTKSNKMMSIMNEKLIHQKTKQERRKVIQSKFQYRR